MTHKCAIGTCHKQVPRHLLMCLDHWRKVTPATQREVYRTFNASQAHRLSDRFYAGAVDQAKREAVK